MPGEVILRVIEVLRKKIKHRYSVSPWTQIKNHPVSVQNKNKIGYEQLGSWYKHGRWLWAENVYL